MKTKAPARKPRASTPPEHDRFADLASAHHTAAQTASGTQRMAHEQLSALYADAAHLALLARTTGATKELRAKLTTLKGEIADVQKRLA